MKRESRILWDPDDTWISDELVNDLVASENTAAMKSRPGVAKTAPDGNPVHQWITRDDNGGEHVYVARTAALRNGVFVLDVFLGNRWHAHCTWDQFGAVVTAAWKRHCDARNKTPEQKLDELTQDVRRLEEEVRRLRTHLAAKM